jgi:hypothetical protein
LITIRTGIFLASSFIISHITAQQADCTLGIGGRDTDVVVKVFKLNTLQQDQLSQWIAELQSYQKDMSDQIRELFDTHPQQNPEEMEVLASKYKALRDEIEATSKAFDRKLLDTFDERQYARYMALCKEASRQAM